jgi:hypothetical protein
MTEEEEVKEYILKVSAWQRALAALQLQSWDYSGYENGSLILITLRIIR